MWAGLRTMKCIALPAAIVFGLLGGFFWLSDLAGR